MTVGVLRPCAPDPAWPSACSLSPAPPTTACQQQLQSIKPSISMSSSGKIVYAPRGESGHANSRKFAALGRRWSLLRVISRGENPRPSASGSHSRARQLAIIFDLVRRTSRSSAFPHFRLSTRNVLILVDFFHGLRNNSWMWGVRSDLKFG